MRFLAVLVVGGLGCGDVSENPKPDAKQVDSMGMVDTPTTPPRCSPSAAFGTPQAVTELNTTGYEEGAHLSPDELTVYFSRGGDIYVAKRTTRDEAFGAPALLAGITTTGEQLFPSVTADGLFLYATIGPSTNYEIAVAERASTTTNFGALNAVASLSSAKEDSNQTVLPDHSAIWFNSSRDSADTTADIFRATRNVGGTFDAPVAITALNMVGMNERAPAITPDELTIYIAADRAPASATNMDIFVAKRTTTNDGFGQPAVVAEVSSSSHDFPTWVSADGCVLYFMRQVGQNDYDIFSAQRGL